MRTRSVLILLWLLPLPIAVGIIPLIRFESERIVADVYPAAVDITCEFHYRNYLPIPVVQALIFPLPVDADHPDPGKIEAVEKNSQQPVPLFDSFGQQAMSVWFAPFSSRTVLVRYRQDCRVPNARYILLTTKPWRENLKQGVYTLHEHGTRVTSSNYCLKRTSDNDLSFTRSDFMPDKDWLFEWNIPTGDIK